MSAPDSFWIRLLTANDVATMQALLSVFGDAFEDAMGG